MIDRLSKEERSANMRAIRAKDTKPELVVRSLLHRLGFRFRLHKRDLPGKPDLYLAKYRTAVFVHGCFWHMHSCKRGRSRPSTNSRFWEAKRKSNVERDARALKALKAEGIRPLIVWECEIKKAETLARRLVRLFRVK